MVIKKLASLALLLGISSLAGWAHAANKSPDKIAADAVRAGCSVSFFEEPLQDLHNPSSGPLFNVKATWQCRDGEILSIDSYEVNGSSPKVVTVFYWQNREIVTLVRWSVNSKAADYVGDYYQVFIYKYVRSSKGANIVRDSTAMKAFPEGWDGVRRDGAPVIYAFKDAASIRKRLRAIQLGQ